MQERRQKRLKEQRRKEEEKANLKTNKKHKIIVICLPG